MNRTTPTAALALLLATLAFADTLQLELTDPLHPEAPAETYSIHCTADAQGVPTGYSLHLQTATCFDGKCKPLDVTLRWDAFGRYAGLETAPDAPLTRKEHDPFEPEHYQRLDRILADTGSLLGREPVTTFVPTLTWAPKRGASASQVDAVSGATPLAVQGAVVPGAAYTSWVLWHWVNGEAAAKLRAHTAAHGTPAFLKRCLGSADAGEVRFALEHLLTLTPPDRQYTGDCLQVLRTAGRPNCVLALRYLQKAVPDANELALQLVPLLGENAGSTALLYRHFEGLPNVRAEVWERLAARLTSVLPREQLALLELLRTRAHNSDPVRRQVAELCEGEAPIVMLRAKQFLRQTDAPR